MSKRRFHVVFYECVEDIFRILFFCVITILSKFILGIKKIRN